MMANKPQDAHGQSARRTEIISVAADLFNSAGYHQTSMNDIADHLGIAKPSIYHYYAGKAQILAAIHEEFVTAMSGRFEDRAKAGLPLGEQLLEVMVDIFTFIEERRGHVRMFYENQGDLAPDTRAHVTELRSRFTAQVTELIQGCIDAGEFRAVDAKMAARAMFGMCNWSYHWYHPSKTMSARATAEAMHELLVRGLQA